MCLNKNLFQCHFSTINAVMTDLGLNQASSVTGWQLTA